MRLSRRRAPRGFRRPRGGHREAGSSGAGDRSVAPSARRRERLEGLLEAGEGRAHHAGADLAGPGLAPRHARIDEGRDARLHDLPHIDANGTAAIVEGWDTEAGMLAHADLRHLLRDRDGLSEAARPHEGGDGGRGGHGKAAEPYGLDDGAVADIRIGVRGAEARKVEALWRIDGRGEPAIAEARHAYAEVRAIAGHGHHHSGARDIETRIRR